MTAATPPQVCSNPDCTVASTNQCVEGLELTACPHFGHFPLPPETTAQDPEESEVATELLIKLPTANTLTVEEAADVRRARPSRLIAVLGAHESGKTSLIASVYELFQTGPIGSALFARSLTLQAFEQTCHDARVASNRGTPHTERTQNSEVRFYHLDIAHGASYPALALLLGDRKGEEYDNALNNDDDSAFPEVRAADTITILVDGERLQDPKTRTTLISKIQMLVRLLVERGDVNGRQHLGFVLTKLDYIAASEYRERTLGDFEALTNKIAERYSEKFASFHRFRVAASPKNTLVGRGTGVADVFDFWQRAQQLPPTTIPPLEPAHRMIARFQPGPLA